MVQYLEDGFMPTVDETRQYGDTLAMQTIDPNTGSNLVSKRGHDLKRVDDADFLTEDQEMALDLQ